MLHLPILFAFFWFGSHANTVWRGRFRFCTALFLHAHACIHAYVSNAPAYTFDSMLSQILIFGAGGLCTAYLILAYRTGVK